MSEVDSSGQFGPALIDSGPGSTSIDRLAESIGQTGGAIGKSGATRESGLLTIVFCDIKNSAERASELGETPWLELLNKHEAVIAQSVKVNRGRVVKRHDDGFMMTFQSARQALLASIGIHRELEQSSGDMIRIGLHVGEGLMDRQGEVFGHYVNKAARIASVAEGGQIMVSDLVQRITVSRDDLVFGEPTQAILMGIELPATVYEVKWRESLM